MFIRPKPKMTSQTPMPETPIQNPYSGLEWRVVRETTDHHKRNINTTRNMNPGNIATSLQPFNVLHKTRPQPNIDNTPNPESRHNLPHSRETGWHIIPPDPSRALRPRQSTHRLPIIKIQAEQVHRCTGELHQGWTGKLRHGGFHGGRRGYEVRY